MPTIAGSRKYLKMTEEFVRKALTIEFERSTSRDDIVTILEALINIHGTPEFVRMDHGTETSSIAVADWYRFNAPEISFIGPEPPWQNTYIESFNANLRDELLGIEIFTTLLEAKMIAEDYRQDYNYYRPHSSLG